MFTGEMERKWEKIRRKKSMLTKILEYEKLRDANFFLSHKNIFSQTISGKWILDIFKMSKNVQKNGFQNYFNKDIRIHSLNFIFCI